MNYRTKLDVIDYQGKTYVSVENLIEFWSRHFKGNFVSVMALVESFIELNKK